jgi:hypothetical protein
MYRNINHKSYTPKKQHQLDPTIYPTWWGHPASKRYNNQSPIHPSYYREVPTYINENEMEEVYGQNYRPPLYENKFSSPVTIIRNLDSGKKQKTQTPTEFLKGGKGKKAGDKKEQKKKPIKKRIIPPELRNVQSKIKDRLAEDKNLYKQTGPEESNRQDNPGQGEDVYESQQQPLTLGRQEGNITKTSDQNLLSSTGNRFSHESAALQSKVGDTTSLNQRASSKEELAKKNSQEGRIQHLSEEAPMTFNSMNPVEAPMSKSLKPNENPRY